MPLYEGKHNTTNFIRVDDSVRESVRCGTDKVIGEIASGIIPILKNNGAVALDGWYGVDFEGIAKALECELENQGMNAKFIPAISLFSDEAVLAEYKQDFITNDPSFGYCNMDGRIPDIQDKDKLSAMQSLLKNKTEPVVLYGYGSAVEPLYESFDRTYYFDKTRQPLLWEMWDGKLIPFGKQAPDANYGWKEYYYCDFFLLHFQKEFLLERAEYYVEAVNFGDLKLMPMNAYHEILKTMLKYPIKEVEIYQPGPWGAYRYKDLWDIEGLECNAWNELAGPELSILIDIGDDKVINMPFANLLFEGDDLTGRYLTESFPHLFPLDAWLDDGYFPKPTPAERISMPIHTHPGTDYVKRRFNEPLGRYETYYIAEAYEGANTWMGFYNDADLEEWERKCRDSNNLEAIPDWKDYICNWKSKVGDLYLIPPGTDHGHGGNQMILELDTCPSIAGTEYSFFTYDFARNSWDDNTKTMTGKPMKMHLDHSFNVSKFRREDYVKEKLRATPEVIKWDKDYYLERYSSLPEMPFEIERITYYNCGEYDTLGKFCHVLTLTQGKKAKIYSKNDPRLCTEINLFQAAVIPASFGAYILESDGSGVFQATLVRWKKG